MKETLQQQRWITLEPDPGTKEPAFTSATLVVGDGAPEDVAVIVGMGTPDNNVGIRTAAETGQLKRLLERIEFYLEEHERSLAMRDATRPLSNKSEQAAETPRA